MRDHITCRLEFKQKDGNSGSLQTNLRTLFKSGGARVSLKPYESGDGLLSFDPQRLLRRLMRGFRFPLNFWKKLMVTSFILIGRRACHSELSTLWRLSSRRGRLAALPRTLLLKCVIVFLVWSNVQYRRRLLLSEASLSCVVIIISVAKGLSVYDFASYVISLSLVLRLSFGMPLCVN